MSRHNPNLPKQRKPCDLPSEQSSKSFWHSEPSSLLLGHRSTRDLPETADVVVIGSGISGASIAHHLFNDGDTGGKKPHVVMLEAREACWGATGRVRYLPSSVFPRCLSLTQPSRMAVIANQSSSNTQISPKSAASSSQTSKHWISSSRKNP